jgi:choline dehydrogenase-like flavoprotein
VLAYKRNNFEAHEPRTARLRSVLDYIGAHDRLIPMNIYLGHQFPFNLAHEMGTLKMGNDLRTFVLDRYCRPHGLDNVYVTDGSFFVSAGAVNPTLTIVAQTLRVADHLRQRLGAPPLEKTETDIIQEPIHSTS